MKIKPLSLLLFFLLIPLLILLFSWMIGSGFLSKFGLSTATATATATAIGMMGSKEGLGLPEGLGKGLGKGRRTPVYFLSHGGPNIMYQTSHPAYQHLQLLGREITTRVKPKAIVVFSAHWSGDRDTIEVNTAEQTDLIYDFYGFPSHYYKETYPNVGSKEVAGKVVGALREAGIKVREVERGLDHGVWSSFKCAFDPKTNPLNIPIVQVSLFANDSPTQHHRLGQALSHLRSPPHDIQIIVSGMAVHNLRDMRFSFGQPHPMPYTVSFDEALKEAVETDPSEGKRERALEKLLERGDARKAHPSFEHLLPIHVGAGAAGVDKGVRLWTLLEGSLSWAQFRFGEVDGGDDGHSL